MSPESRAPPQRPTACRHHHRGVSMFAYGLARSSQSGKGAERVLQYTPNTAPDLAPKLSSKVEVPSSLIFSQTFHYPALQGGAKTEHKQNTNRTTQTEPVQGWRGYLILVVPRCVEGRGSMFQPNRGAPVDDLLSQPHEADECAQRACHHKTTLQTIRQ